MDGNLVSAAAVAIAVGSLLIERFSAHQINAKQAEQRASAAEKDANAALQTRLQIKDSEVADLQKSRDYWRDRARAAEREAQSAKDDLFRVLREGKGLDT